jgi:hypothetical protein
METLKEFDNILEPDERQKHFLLFDEALGHDRPLKLNDLYLSATGIKLHDKVPENIRNHFATAQNLLVYSWFFHPFNVTAEFIAYVTIEYALKERFKPKSQMSFKKLLKKAIQEGIVKDEYFSHYQNLMKIKELQDITYGDTSPEVKKYTEMLSETIPYFRNELAHGSPILQNNGAFTLHLCADIINQLFEE